MIITGNIFFHFSSFECQAEGRFPHPKDCGTYVDCFRSPLGFYVSHIESCNEGAYSKYLKTCIPVRIFFPSYINARKIAKETIYPFLLIFYISSDISSPS